eukprot:COSAG06_NODE_666_length_13272_cov_10.674334_3_plen_75_part_00
MPEDCPAAYVLTAVHSVPRSIWARKSGTLIGRDQAMMTLLRAGWAGAAAGAPRFAPTIAPPDRMLVGRGSGVAG